MAHEHTMIWHKRLQLRGGAQRPSPFAWRAMVGRPSRGDRRTTDPSGLCVARRIGRRQGVVGELATTPAKGRPAQRQNSVCCSHRGPYHAMCTMMCACSYLHVLTCLRMCACEHHGESSLFVLCYLRGTSCACAVSCFGLVCMACACVWCDATFWPKSQRGRSRVLLLSVCVLFGAPRVVSASE